MAKYLRRRELADGKDTVKLSLMIRTAPFLIRTAPFLMRALYSSDYPYGAPIAPS